MKKTKMKDVKLTTGGKNKHYKNKQENYLVDFNLNKSTRDEYEYYHHWIEIPYDMPIIEIFAGTYEMEENEIDEEKETIYNDINIDKLNRAIKKLTFKQQRVLELLLDGKNQLEIAATLGVHQTTIHKTLFGNRDYRYKDNHGGILKKLKILMGNDID